MSVGGKPFERAVEKGSLEGKFKHIKKAFMYYCRVQGSSDGQKYYTRNERGYGTRHVALSSCL
jgi:hypothetical protein